MKPSAPDPIRDLCQLQARRLGLTAYAVAKAAGVSETQVRSFLAGQTHMRSDNLHRVIGALGIGLVCVNNQWINGG